MNYRSGEGIRKGDRVLYHGESAQVEFVASGLKDPETEWYVREHGDGIMLRSGAFGRVFIPLNKIAGGEDLEFVSRTGP